MDYYASTDGGPLPDGTPTVAGLSKLLDQIQEQYEHLVDVGEPITAYLRGGTYYMESPLRFDPQRPGSGITLKAYPGEEPVLCGARPVGDWEESRINGVPCWRTRLEEVADGSWYFHQLFVDGDRRPRGRYPQSGALPSVASDKEGPLFGASSQFGYSGSLEGLEWNPDLEVVFDHYWIHDRTRVTAIDTTARVVSLDPDSPMFMHVLSENEFYFENARCAVTEPGQWHLERNTGFLYYIPREGESRDHTAVYAPVASRFVEIAGDEASGDRVEFVNLEGITFRYCRSEGIKNSGQAAHTLSGAITFRHARNCAIRNCTIDGAGTYAVDIQEGCSRLEIRDCVLTHSGAGGIKVNGSDKPGDDARQTSRIGIRGNEIVHGGRLYRDAIGVLLMHASRVHVYRNHIYDFYYSGLSCGWTWGLGESVSHSNRIEYNHVHRIGQKTLSDLGGMYYLGIQPGTVIRGNRVHDVSGKEYGGSGIYLDEGASHMLVEGNRVYDTQGPSFNMHYGRENIVRSNVFIAGEEGAVALAKRKRGREPGPNTALNLSANIIVTQGQPVFTGGYRYHLADDEIRSNGNVIWARDGGPLMVYDEYGKPQPVVGPHTFDEWQALGNDTLSVFADPGFADLDGRDFALGEDSCAHKVGFRPLLEQE